MSDLATIKELSAAGRHQESLQACQNVLQGNPEEAFAYKYAGKSLLALGQLEKAQQCLVKAHQLDGSDPEIAKDIGNIFMNLGDQVNALGWYEKALEINNDYAPAINNLANLKKQSGNNQEAVELFQRAIQADPKLVQAYIGAAASHLALKDLDQAESFAEQALGINENTPGANEILGLVFQNKSNPERAIEHYQKELNIHPHASNALLNQGLLLLQQNQPRKALEQLAKASALAPSEQCSLLLAQTHQNLGQFKEAIIEYKKLNAHQSQNKLIPFNFGLCLLEIGENNAAIKAFQTSIKLDETFIAAWGNIGAALISESRHQEALPATQKVLELDPDNPTAHMNLGSIYKELGNLDQALASILKSLELKPDDSDAHMNLGGIYKKLGELDQALASTLQSLELKPDNPTALMNLGGIYKDLGKLDQALASTLKSLELKPDNADAHMLIGSIYKDLGNLDQAIASFTQHFELTSAHVETKAIISNVIDSHVRKIISQDNIPTFFDKAVDRALRGIGASQCDELKIYESLVDSKKDRFITLAKRKAKTQGQRQLDGMPISVSQGTHSLIKWKDYEIFKTANDLAIYSMIINEVRPEIIIEIGSGVGGSAIWMSDICNALGLETHIYSYDIKKPDIVNKNVTFIEFDLCKIGNSACLPLANSFMGKSKIVIEDAHVNVLNVMNELNTFLYKGDYLVIEDSSGKQRQIEEFVLIQGEKYRVDQFFLDFFGINMSCSIDSIFRVF